MPPEPLPFDRKDFLKDRKPSSADHVGIVPQRWREPPTTPSQHNIHGSSSFCRWGAGGGPSDFRRPFSGLHGKRVGGGWHNTTIESSSKENNCMTNSVSMAFDGQKDPKGVNSWETTASPNGNSLPHNDFVNSLDQLHSADQHAKNSGGGFSTTNNQRLEKETSLGSSLDWKPLKWIRSGSLSSRGSGFSHSSGCKIIGVVDPFNGKLGTQLGNNTPLRSPSEDASPCLTPMTHDEANSRKKQRLGWGEGLAKYEKKKVDPEDILDKEAGARNVMVDGVSGSEPLLTSPSSLTDKSPSVNGYSECASPTTPYSYACSSSPGLEEKESTKTITVDNDTYNPSVASCHVSENHTEGLSSNLELNLSSALDELLQTDDSSSPGPKFVKSTAMDKLHVWKAELTKTLEITETEIDSLEHELKSLVSDAGSFPTEYQNKTCGGPLPVEKTDSSPEEVNGAEDSDDKSSDTTSEFVESVSKCSEDVGNDDALGFVTSCGDHSSSTVSDGEDVDNGREDDKLYDFIFATNKVIANETSDELNRILLPTTHLCNKISKSTDESLNKTKIASRKRFLKFKERVITSKFRVLQHAWKEDLQLLSVKKTGGRSQKKFESSSRMGYADHQKYSSSIHSRLYPPGGSVSLVPTTETLDYVKKLLSDSRVKVHRKTLKMPCLILDRSERMMTRFVSDNGLVEDPVEVEKERSIVSAWTEEEQGIFLEKYSLFGKDFKKIASFLKNRTCGDCVEFYYKNHKSDCFQKIKKKSAFAKGMSCITNTYLVTSGRRMAADATSLEMLGAASEMVASVDGEQKLDSGMFCNEQETAAADVLAGICRSVSSEALGSCITSSVDNGDVQHHEHGRRRSRCQMVGGGSCSKRRQHLTQKEDVDDESCSDESCGEEVDTSTWSDAEKIKFIKAFRSCGKNFANISICVKTKTIDQCRVFFSKARKCLGLDVIDVEQADNNQEEEEEEEEEEGEDALMVDSGSDISQDNKSSLECSKMDNLVGSNGENTYSGEQSCASDDAKVASSEIFIQEGIREEDEEPMAMATTETDGCLDLNCNNMKLSCSDGNNGLLVSNLFPGNPTANCAIPFKKTIRIRQEEDESASSSRLSFRKSCEEDKKYESKDGFHLNLVPKHSLMDCAADESSQVFRGYPVNSGMIGYSEATQSQSQSKLKLGESLLMEARGPQDVEKPSRTGHGNVKLFGQIITNQPPPQAQAQAQENGCGGKVKSFGLKFDDDDDRRKVDVDVDVDTLLRRSDNGYWGDGNNNNRIRIPDSARLLAKYPAAFSKTSSFHPFTKFDQHQHSSSSSLNKIISAGFPSCSKNGGGRQEGVVDKLLLPNVNVVGGISDAVAAIRMHYAYAANKTESLQHLYDYNNKVEDEAAAWRRRMI
ncbi:uncharacterized protein LOC111888279 isoform X1 [Lactuca sativa]|uniref:SANT domain-containing protein n=2 Tax=Lactuca sativa TaxID=4236 RepID=A0A9R1XNZ0_LACSA|nr:uncharacterized protein LOC111888279 isoform X1 [Lactuca sativa]KAJ0219939.1 hypothetical protein LSAT_V11C200092370 [Lactuca sativa]